MASKKDFTISQATSLDKQQILSQIHDFNMPNPRKYRFFNPDKIFVAKKENKVLGFVVVFPEGNGVYEVSSLYLRLGMDRRGIGSKLLGRANGYLVGVGAKMAHLSASTGRYIRENKEFLDGAYLFYSRTNYKPESGKSAKFVWTPTASKRVRKARGPRPKVGLAPQNVLRPEARLARRRRRHL